MKCLSVQARVVIRLSRNRIPVKSVGRRAEPSASESHRFFEILRADTDSGSEYSGRICLRRPVIWRPTQHRKSELLERAAVYRLLGTSPSDVVPGICACLAAPLLSFLLYSCCKGDTLGVQGTFFAAGKFAGASSEGVVRLLSSASVHRRSDIRWNVEVSLVGAERITSEKAGPASLPSVALGRPRSAVSLPMEMCISGLLRRTLLEGWDAPSFC